MEIKLGNNECLFRQNDDDSKHLYKVIKGTLSVSKEIDRKTIDCGILEPGDIFGEISMILGTKRGATVVAKTDEVIVKQLDEKDCENTRELPCKEPKKLKWLIRCRNPI